MTWIKVWIGIGVVAFFCLTVMPPYLTYRAQQEVTRYRECTEGTRNDCERSIVWNLVDIARRMDEGPSASSNNLDAYKVNGKSAVTAPTRSSEKAPLIKKVDRTYDVANVTLSVSVEGVTRSVEAYFQNKLVGTLTRQKNGTWQGPYTLPPEASGELEVRAQGDDPKDRSSFFLPVAAN